MLAVTVARRRELFFDTFTARKVTALNGSQTPFAIFVKKLQESLTRMESFEVVTVAQSLDGKLTLPLMFLRLLDVEYAESKRSSPSLLARQLRLRLTAADDSDVPRNLSNIIVSIHAIATFQALHDYLRPRVAGLLSGGSRISGMLAALAASGLAASSSAQSEPPKLPALSDNPSDLSSMNAGIGRRRSQRLSAKKSDQTTEGPAGSADEQTTQAEESGDIQSTENAPAAESALSDTVVNDDEFAAEFTDDDVDVDAEV